MTTEANIPYRQILEGLQQGADGDDKTLALLQLILGNAQLGPEEQMILEFLASLQDGEEDGGAQVIGSDYQFVDDDYDNVSNVGRSPNRSTIERFQEELADLREVNDTVAAALGACHYCWGGDSECSECEGRGSPGWRPPHPSLFEALVVPAVQRAHAIRRKPRHALR